MTHMQANGYRAANRPGAHQSAGPYAEATLGTGTALTYVIGLSTACAGSATGASTTSSRSPNDC